MSFQHNGLSGFGLRREGEEVVKWTRGVESTKILKESYMIQKRAHDRNFLHPMRALEITSVMDLIDFGEYFEFRMPYVESDSAYFYQDGYHLIDHIRRSISYRKSVAHVGFKEIVSDYLIGIKPSAMKFEVEQDLEKTNDLYPKGFCHGDFGLANMLIIDDVVHLIDFTPSFIQTPLMDIATLEMCIVHMEVAPWHIELLKQLKKDNADYADKISILRKCKVLGFKDYSSDHHREVFYGLK